MNKRKKQARILYLNDFEKSFFDDNYIKFSKFLHDLLFEVMSLKKENKDAIQILRNEKSEVIEDEVKSNQ